MDNRLEWHGPGWYASHQTGQTVITRPVPDTEDLDKFDYNEASKRAREARLGTPIYMGTFAE